MGTKKVQVTGQRSFYTYAYVHGLALNAYDTAKEQEAGRSLHCVTAVIFCAFTSEAYLNHIGLHQIADWDQKERKLSWRQKLELIGRELKTTFDRGKRLFQTLTQAFDLRDRLAHGKSVTDEKFSGHYTLGDHAENSYLDPDWLKMYQSPESVKKVLDDLGAALRQLQYAAGLGR